MKKVFLLMFLLSISCLALTQNNNKNVNVRIEGIRVGDSTYYLKTTTTKSGGKVKVEREVLNTSKKDNAYILSKYNSNLSTKTEDNTSSSLNSRSKTSPASIMGVNLIFSTLNNNSTLNTLLGMKGINNINIGGDIYLGRRFGFGMELKGAFAMESLINRTDKKKLHSVSTIGVITCGYPFRIKEDKYMVVPYLGLGFNVTELKYSQTSNRAISFEELKDNSWAVYSNNIFIPLGLEFRYRLLSVSYLSFGLEYRFNIYNSGAMLPNTRQKVYDFPEFSINNLGIKIGLTGIFNKYK